MCKKIYQEQGIKGFYRGFVPQFWRDVPTFGIYFLSYNLFQKLLRIDPTLKITQQNVWYLAKKMTAGGLAGALTWFFAYPFDVIKSAT